MQLFAPALTVPMSTVEHVLDEAPACIYGVFMGLPVYNRRVFLTNSLVGGGRALGVKIKREYQFCFLVRPVLSWSE